MSDIKTCRKCKEPRTLTDSGRYRCRPCDRSYQREFNKKRRESQSKGDHDRHKDQMREWMNKEHRLGFLNSRISKIKSTYGITEDEIEQILNEQKGVCPICDYSLNDKFAVDHCHSTNKVRGFIHNKCNLGLGFFKDDVAKLAGAIKYLEKHKKDNNEEN